MSRELRWAMAASTLYRMSLQDQYIFIHDAVLESLSCGDTQIQAGDLVKAIQKLREKDEVTQRTGYETQFQVWRRGVEGDTSPPGHSLHTHSGIGASVTQRQ